MTNPMHPISGIPLEHASLFDSVPASSGSDGSDGGVRASQCILPASETAALTNREQACLRWTAQGKARPEIARLLEISEASTIFHLHNATRKLGAHSLGAAVQLAFLRGLV